MAPRRHAAPNGGPVVCRFGSPARSPFSTPRQSPPRDCAAAAPAPASTKQPSLGVAPSGQAPHAGNPQEPMPDRWRPLDAPEAKSSSPGAGTGPAFPSALHSEPQTQGVADNWAESRAEAQAQACGDQGHPLSEQGAERLQPGSYPAQDPAEASSLLRPFSGEGSEQGCQHPEREGVSAGEGQGQGSGVQFLGPMEVNSVWAAVMARLEQESAAQAGEGAQQVGGQGQEQWQEQGQEKEGEEDSGCAMDIDGVAEISERFLGTRLDSTVDVSAVSQHASLLSHLTWGESAQSLDGILGPTPAAEPQSEGAAQAAGLYGAFSTQGFMGGGDIVPGGTFPAPASQSSAPQAPTAYAPQGPLGAPHQQATTPAGNNNPLLPLAAQSQAPELSLRRRLLLQQAGVAEAAAASAASGGEGVGAPGFRRRDFLPTILESGGLLAGGGRADLALEAVSSSATGFGAHPDLPSPGPKASTPFPGSASTSGRFSRREVPRQRLEPSQPLASQLSPSLAALLSVLSNENEAERRRGGPGAAGAGSSSISGSSGAGAGSGRAGVGGGAAGVPSVGFPDLEMELTPTLSALLSILSFDAEPDSPPRLQASRSYQPARSESELALCELELDMDEPHSLQRQSSLDSGIPGRKSRGSLGPSPTGSLHSSPRESPVRTRESSLHSTPSPVLQRRFTGNRVSVVNECWQAGAGRRGEAGPSGLRSVSEVLEEEGTAAFYRGFKADASPVRPNSKRTKRDRS